MNVSRAHLKLVTSNYSIVKCQLEICRPGGNIGRRGTWWSQPLPTVFAFQTHQLGATYCPQPSYPLNPHSTPNLATHQPPTLPIPSPHPAFPPPNSIHLLFTPSQSTTLFASLLLSLVCQIHIKSIWTCIVKVTN